MTLHVHRLAVTDAGPGCFAVEVELRDNLRPDLRISETVQVSAGPVVEAAKVGLDHAYSLIRAIGPNITAANADLPPPHYLSAEKVRESAAETLTQAELAKAQKELDLADSAPQPNRPEGERYSLEDHVICALRSLRTATAEIAEKVAAIVESSPVWHRRPR